MKLDLDVIVRDSKQVRGVALSSTAGEPLGCAGELDADTLCAVASLSAVQLCNIGELLAAGPLERWYLVTERDAYYVSERPLESHRLVAVGDAVKSPEATSKALHKAAEHRPSPEP